jgi:hypothetical protein
MPSITTDMNATLKELAKAHFYGAIEIKLEDGRIVLIRKTENFKPPMEKPGYARTTED